MTLEDAIKRLEDAMACRLADAEALRVVLASVKPVSGYYAHPARRGERRGGRRGFPGQGALFGDALAVAVRPWLRVVGHADRWRLEALVALAVGDRHRLNVAARAAFPSKRGKRAVRAVSSFRKRVNDAAAEHGIRIRWMVDSALRSEPTRRWCWFAELDPNG